MANFAATYQGNYPRRPIYLTPSSAEMPCPEALGYMQGKTLGSGTYAKVKAAWSPYEQKMIAIKNLHKKAASKEYLSKFLPREIEVLQLVNHPNIIRVYQIIETEERCYFMLEIAENGDLLDYINARGRIPEDEARYMFKQMTSAIEFCHSNGVVHRDLKCENIMLSRDMQVKIGDFGFAVHTDSPLSTPCGSYSYAAPELFHTDSKGYDGKKADVWSLGVILYAMASGRLPFGDDSQVKKTKDRVLAFNRHLSNDCKSLIRCCLSIKPEERCNCADVLSHIWFAQRARSPALLQCRPKYTLDNCLPMIIYPEQQQQQSFLAPRPQEAISQSAVPVQGHPYKAAQIQSVAGPSHGDAVRTIQVDGHATAQTVQQAKNPKASKQPPKTQSQHKQIMAKIAVAGRKLAESMRSGSSNKGHLESNSSRK